MQIFNGTETVEQLLQRLQNCKQGSQREQQVFACIVHNIFDEYRFFHKYPDRERYITALLFGGLVGFLTPSLRVTPPQ